MYNPALILKYFVLTKMQSDHMGRKEWQNVEKIGRSFRSKLFSLMSFVAIIILTFTSIFLLFFLILRVDPVSCVDFNRDGTLIVSSRLVFFLSTIITLKCKMIFGVSKTIFRC
jgi:hypothetical protein